MKVEETYRVYIDGDWIEDLESEEEIKEKVEDWINGINYLEDEELDLVYESVVSKIIIEFVVTDVTDQMIMPSKKDKKEINNDIFLYNPPL